MTPLEKDMERALVGAVKRRGGMALKWVCPGWAGVPDRIVLLPGGRILFAELKRPKGGEVRKLQEWWHERLRRLVERSRTASAVPALQLRGTE